MSAIQKLLEEGVAPKTCQPGVWYVRLKPFDRRAGHLLRDLTLSRWRLRVREAKGWHRVQTQNEEMLRDLVGMTQTGQPADRYAAKAFDVCTFEEAKLAEKREREERMQRREVRADVDHATTLRSSDLPSTRRTRADDAAELRKREDARRKAEAEEREARRAQARAEAAAMSAAEKEAEIARLEREKAAAEAALEEMDREDEALFEGDDEDNAADPEAVIPDDDEPEGDED
jgi:hypothetical protein